MVCREGEGEAGVEFVAEEEEEEDVECEGGEGEENDCGLGKVEEGECDDNGNEEDGGKDVGPPGGEESAGVVDGDGNGVADGE